MSSQTTVTIHEAARRLGVHPDTVRRRVKSGDIEATKVFGRFLILEASIDALIEAGRIHVGEKAA